jgi:hypothetical protein
MRRLSIPLAFALMLIAIPLSAQAQPAHQPALAIRTECTTFSYGGNTYFFCVDINPVADCSGYSLQNPTPWPSYPSTIYYRTDWTQGGLSTAPSWHSSLDGGTWTDPSMLESFHWLAEFRFYPGGGAFPPGTYFSVWHDFDILEPSSCMPISSPPSCTLTPSYYMYTLYDENQPPGWQPYCYIISSNGYPGVEIQASLCTPLGSEHTFKATNIPFGGWVYTDCNGRVSYGWPYWQISWYQPQFAK